MVQIIVGIFLILLCLFFILIGPIDFFAALIILSFFCVALWFIIIAAKKINNNKQTSKKGEKCYARILGCSPTGTVVLNKEEYQVITALYIPSTQEKIIVKEVVGYDNYYEYPKDSYLEVLYYNNDINIEREVEESEIPKDILNILNDSAFDVEYEGMQNNYSQRIEELQEKTEFIANKVDKIIGIISAIGFYIFSIITIIASSYFSKMIELLKDFEANIPMSIIFPAVLIVDLVSIAIMCTNPVNSKKRLIFGLLYAASEFFIILHSNFI